MTAARESDCTGELDAANAETVGCALIESLFLSRQPMTEGVK
jgi:hypothetical protein